MMKQPLRSFRVHDSTRLKLLLQAQRGGMNVYSSTELEASRSIPRFSSRPVVKKSTERDPPLQ